MLLLKSGAGLRKTLANWIIDPALRFAPLQPPDNLNDEGGAGERHRI